MQRAMAKSKMRLGTGSKLIGIRSICTGCVVLWLCGNGSTGIQSSFVLATTAEKMGSCFGDVRLVVKNHSFMLANGKRWTIVLSAKKEGAYGWVALTESSSPF
ncbi:hypothetical protein VNO78_23926 [Psophocarpus tetragonolobus]|uniref:Uncharacterized protein n=1 Tax=Psophocarpus tetragonolobus TaxID=3891 RepID=A0AAN9S7L3_PSOTE